MINKTNEKPLGELIQELLDTYKLTDKLNEAKLIQSWETVVGKMIANHTKQLFIKRKKIFVKFDSAALTHEVSFAKQKIVNALNDKVGEIVVKEMIIL